ncbi:hypothetical protein [Deinococcus petrolearius]|uniref:Uncharacterized protein n=1 Tax=Deinococcus petrolearius TaxID=1751295 RepID=A0ABW1DFF6_9DEIO
MKTLKLTNPLFAPVALPYSTGPLAAPERHQQPEQRHYAGAVGVCLGMTGVKKGAVIEVQPRIGQYAGQWTPATVGQFTKSWVHVTFPDGDSRTFKHPEQVRMPAPDGPHAQPEQQQAQQARVVAPVWEVPMLALNLPTDRAANDALFEAADERARDLLRQELRARERGDWAESERLFTEHRTETAYMAALTAVLPGADWLDA